MAQRHPKVPAGWKQQGKVIESRGTPGLPRPRHLVQDEQVLTPGPKSRDSVLILVDSKTESVGIEAQGTPQVRDGQRDRTGPGVWVEFGIRVIQRHLLTSAVSPQPSAVSH
jgi:hypothetical protein